MRGRMLCTTMYVHVKLSFILEVDRGASLVVGVALDWGA